MWTTSQSLRGKSHTKLQPCLEPLEIEACSWPPPTKSGNFKSLSGAKETLPILDEGILTKYCDNFMVDRT